MINTKSEDPIEHYLKTIDFQDLNPEICRRLMIKINQLSDRIGVQNVSKIIRLVEKISK